MAFKITEPACIHREKEGEMCMWGVHGGTWWYMELRGELAHRVNPVDEHGHAGAAALALLEHLDGHDWLDARDQR